MFVYILVTIFCSPSLLSINSHFILASVIDMVFSIIIKAQFFFLPLSYARRRELPNRQLGGCLWLFLNLFLLLLRKANRNSVGFVHLALIHITLEIISQWYSSQFIISFFKQLYLRYVNVFGGANSNSLRISTISPQTKKKSSTLILVLPQLRGIEPRYRFELIWRFFLLDPHRQNDQICS